MAIKILHQIAARGNNRRIYILLLEDDNGVKSFCVSTKRLISFKDRDILKTRNYYSIETFAVLRDMIVYFLEDKEVSGTLLNQELNGFNTYSLSTTLKSTI